MVVEMVEVVETGESGCERGWLTSTSPSGG